MRLPIAPQAILIDLAGVLHVDEPRPGAAEALFALRASGLPTRFLTNTTRSPRSRIVARLRLMGVAVDADEIQTAVLAARYLVEQRKVHAHDLVHPDIAGEIGRSHAEPDAVVLGDAGPHFDFQSLNTVFRLLMQGLPFMAMARNRFFMKKGQADAGYGRLRRWPRIQQRENGRSRRQAGAPFFPRPTERTRRGPGADGLDRG